LHVSFGISTSSTPGRATENVSKKDFRHKIGLCKKEANETKFWFRMVAAAEPGLKEAARPLRQAAEELHLIFAPIYRAGAS